MRARFRFPMPVYVATLATGERVRISFGSPVGKPLDIARGRYCAAYQCGEESNVFNPVIVNEGEWVEWASLKADAPCCPVREDMTPIYDTSGGWQPLPPKILAEIVSGEVEYEGQSYADPMTATATIWPEGETPKKPAGPSAAAMRDALRDIVEFGNRKEPLSPAALARIAAAALGQPLPAVLRLAA